MNKYIEDGKVGIILSTTVNQGWYTQYFEYSNAHKELLYCPPLVEVLKKDSFTKEEVLEALTKFGCNLNENKEYLNYKDISELYIPDFELHWIPQESKFNIVFDYEDYDAYMDEQLTEQLIILNPNHWLTA